MAWCPFNLEVLAWCLKSALQLYRVVLTHTKKSSCLPNKHLPADLSTLFILIVPLYHVQPCPPRPPLPSSPFTVPSLPSTFPLGVWSDRGNLLHNVCLYSFCYRKNAEKKDNNFAWILVMLMQWDTSLEMGVVSTHGLTCHMVMLITSIRLLVMIVDMFDYY